MKFKKSISLILSTATILNLLCPNLASAHPVTANEENKTSVSASAKIKNDELLIGDTDVDYETVKLKKDKPHTRSDYDEIYDRERFTHTSKQALIDSFILKNIEYFPAKKIQEISSRLQQLSCDKIRALNALSFNNPKHILIVSLLVGELGIDRIIIGKVGTGILKLALSMCGFVPGAIWWFIDLFKIGNLTKQQNWKMLKKAIY